MRICVISPFVDKQHGTERVLAELLQRLSSDYGVEVHLYAQRVADVPQMLRSGSPHDALGDSNLFWRRVSAIPGPHLMQFVWWYFANRIARWRDARFRGLVADLVYSPGINAPDADAITVHIVFHAFYEEVRQHLRLRGTSFQGLPRRIHRLLYYHLIMTLERRIYSSPHVSLSAVSELVAGQLEKYFARKDVLVVRNAVDCRQFNSAARLAKRDDSRKSFGIGSDEFVFLLIGNDWKNKGLDSLLAALSNCADLPLKLLVVGKDDQDAYRAECERKRLTSRVTFLEPSVDVLQFYAAADAYAGPSLKDAYGLPILEAMACGLPVIASTAAGASEIIADRENGLLLHDPRDADSLGALMRELCTLPSLGSVLGAAAERTAAKESWGAYAARMCAHFEEVVARKQRQGSGKK